MPSISIPTAVVSAGASIYGASKASSASKKAAQVQSDAATLAAQNQMKIYGDTKENLAPYESAGVSALGEEQNLLGLGPQGMSGIQSALEATPGYQFTKQQGLESVQNGYAAKGLGSSGPAMKGAEDYVVGLANSTYEQRLGDYLRIAAQGYGASAAQAGFGNQAAQAAGNFSTSGAAAQAAGLVGSANAFSSAASNIAGSVSNGLLLNTMIGHGMFPTATAPTTTGTALAPNGGS